MTHISLIFAALVSILSFCRPGNCEPITYAPAEAIASGKPLWVDTDPEPENAIINTRVDIGTLHQSGDAIEAKMAWTLTLGILKDVSAAHPGVTIPDGSTSIDTERIICRENQNPSYLVERIIVSPDGKTLDRKVFNADEERKKVEDREQAWARRFPDSPKSFYGKGARSLVCWAAARKCEGKVYRWLEFSEYATKMSADYNRFFVPNCRL